jgi:hypothetical protein
MLLRLRLRERTEIMDPVTISRPRRDPNNQTMDLWRALEDISGVYYERYYKVQTTTKVPEYT